MKERQDSIDGKPAMLSMSLYSIFIQNKLCIDVMNLQHALIK